MARIQPRAKGLGVDQAWQNVKASRAANVVYTNTTKNPILVQVTAYSSGSGADAPSESGKVFGKIDGNVAGRSWPRSGYSSAVLTMLVPVGSTYEIDDLQYADVMYWMELR